MPRSCSFLSIGMLIAGAQALFQTPFPLLGLRRDRSVDDHGARLDTSTVSFEGIHERWFTQNLDHFDPGNNRTFESRYWISNRHYKSGGPVIALLAGETSGEDRLEFLDHGIADILARATNGLAVVVEHRYYGKSVPVEDFRTANLKWLTTALALEDNIHFARNADLGYGNSTRSSETPWIWYGGSYAGAQAAFLRKAYPDDVYGAIASSGVIHAQVNFWEYFEPIKANGGQCARDIVKVIEHVDSILMLNETNMAAALKSYFGLRDLADDRDFVNVLAYPLSYWQEQQWNTESSKWRQFCHALGNGLTDTDSSARSLSTLLANYAKFIKSNVLRLCGEAGTSYSIAECFATSFHHSDIASKYDLSQTWRLWVYQVVTEWGYYMPAAPNGIPSLVSRLVDLEYVSGIRAYFQDLPSAIPMWPNVSVINEYGDFGLETQNLMFVDGSADPWLYACSHSPYAPHRADTQQQPFKLIPGGFHHSDEYGLPNDSDSKEPKSIRTIHAEQVQVVKTWLRSWSKDKQEKEKAPSAFKSGL